MENAKSVKEEWNAIIASKLKVGVSIEDLQHEYPLGILMEPNVMKSDIEKYHHTLNVSKPWINMASIEGGSAFDKNKLALLALQQGANGLNIKLSRTDSIAVILKDVLTRYLDVRIDCCDLTQEGVEHQQSLIGEKDFPNIRWVNQNESYDQFHIYNESRIGDIKTLIEVIDLDCPTDIIVSLSKNLLFEIASIRAIRSILDDLNIQSFNILAQYKVDGSNELGDYNLIEKTYKILSGILGGADAILTPYNDDEESRLTLNIHNILDLESGMKDVLDPLNGSYYIEKLTGEIIQKVKATH